LLSWYQSNLCLITNNRANKLNYQLQPEIFDSYYDLHT
jgi:hypothetical protein